jgi:GntR family transcriptional regulator
MGQGKTLPLEINRKTGIPIYLQLSRQIEQMVLAGHWEKGMKLPTEREMAQRLGLSRNTVSMAYRELESQGLLFSRQGRGTFVTMGLNTLGPRDRRERLAGALEMCLEEALLLGFDPEEFVASARAVAERKKEALTQIRVAFVECNREQLDYFARQLELGAGVKILPVMVDDLRRQAEAVRWTLSGVDMVVTTFFHLEEVKDLLRGAKAEVLGIALDPVMETMVRMARVRPGQKVGLVCLSEAFSERVAKSLTNGGIDLEFSFLTSRNEEDLKEFLEDLSIIMVSPGRKKEVERLCPNGTEVVEFIYRPDAGSINLLKSTLLERKSRY